MGNLISCFCNWVQGENRTCVSTLDPDQETSDYFSQIKDGVMAGQHFDELISK